MRGVIALAVLVAMLVAVPSALAAYPANSTYFVPENSTGVYCQNNTIVQVRANVSFDCYAIETDIFFDPNCVNITAVNWTGGAWEPGDPDWSHHGNYVIITSDPFASTSHTGDQLFVNLTLHCVNNTGNCTSSLLFDYVELLDDDANNHLDAVHNGTIDCTPEPINVTIRADSITGNIFNVSNYTVNYGTVTEDGVTVNNHTAMGAMVVYCQDNGINVNLTLQWGGAYVLQIADNASDCDNWCYAVNETKPGVGGAAYDLSGGEFVHWYNRDHHYYEVFTTLNRTLINVDDYINATVTWANQTGTYLLNGASVNVSTMGAWGPNVGPSVGTTGPDGNVTFQWSSPGTWGVYAVDPVHGSGQYKWPAVTFTCNYTILSCDDNGVEKNAFVPGENVSVKGTGLDPNTNYTLWIQDANVSDGDVLSAGEDPSVTQESVLTDANGNFNPTLIWNISAGAAITYNKYDIVADNNDTGTVGTYNATDDDIDAAQVEGFVAPVPEMATIALFGFGLLMLAGYVGLGQRKNRKRE